MNGSSSGSGAAADTPKHQRRHSLDKFSALAAAQASATVEAAGDAPVDADGGKREYFAFSQFETALQKYKLQPLEAPVEGEELKGQGGGGREHRNGANGTTGAGLRSMSPRLARKASAPGRTSLIGDNSLRTALKKRHSTVQPPEQPIGGGDGSAAGNETSRSGKKKKRQRTRSVVATELGNLLNQFREEAQREDSLLTVLEESARANPEFARGDRCEEWTVYEVCYWLISIEMDDYIFHFHKGKVDGKMLLSYDFDREMLVKELHVKKVHAKRILRELAKLKSEHLTSESVHESRVSKLADLEAEIEKLKAQNDELKQSLEKEKSVPAEPSPTPEEAEDAKTATATATPSLSASPEQLAELQATAREKDQLERRLRLLTQQLVAKDKAIDILKDALSKFKEQHQSRMREETRKVRDLEKAYVKLETHYEKQLQSKEAQGMPQEMSMLWEENQSLGQELEEERDSNRMLQKRLKTLQMEIVREKRKSNLLENQTTRLTEELTKYLLTASFVIDEERPEDPRPMVGEKERQRQASVEPPSQRPPHQLQRRESRMKRAWSRVRGRRNSRHDNSSRS